ncbi:MAG: hypothetical protein HYY52_02285 [Candidatus Melainabacteria bacterium]|nr:hypothetical protein [Candidatus Melainabacteria bacterium]
MRINILIKDLKDCTEFIAGDNSVLRELLHPVDPAWKKEDEEIINKGKL